MEHGWALYSRVRAGRMLRKAGFRRSSPIASTHKTLRLTMVLQAFAKQETMPIL